MNSEPPGAAVRSAVDAALAEDVLPIGDLTAALLDRRLQATAAFVARSEGVVAGIACAARTLHCVDEGLSQTWRRAEGDKVLGGEEIGRVSGCLRSIVTAERVALNFLSHLSGVATLTRRFVDAAEAANPSCRVLDTRKTTPGLRALEKAAVRAGGGRNHRANLSEGILVKDNHLAGLAIAEAVSAARDRWPGRMVEVECDDMDQVLEAVGVGADMVLLDNMTPPEVTECVRTLRERSVRAVLVEVSGGVTLESVAAYAAAGADLVSVGALTHSAPILDVGLDLVG